jgi:arylsulfatase A-like enzyme
MSLYGYHRQTTPNLTRFAQSSTVYHAHYAAGNFTTPGTASILTGVYPWSHHALHFLGNTTAKYKKRNIFHLFAEQGYRTITYTHNTLTQVLLHQFREDLNLHKKIGELGVRGKHIAEAPFFEDFGVAMQSEWLLLRDLYRDKAPSSLFFSLLNRGARHFLDDLKLPKETETLFPRGAQTNFGPFGGMSFILEHAIDWIEAELSRSPQPFLGYFHLYPPHEPYHPRQEFIGLFDDDWLPSGKPSHFFPQGHSDDYLNDKRRQYDEHIAYADAEVGRLYDTMIERALTDNTYVVVTSDHGQLFERGIHGHNTETLYEPVVRVPLLISAPGQRQRRDIFARTSCVDLLPTLLHAICAEVPDWCEGEVLPPFTDQPADNKRSVFVLEAKRIPKQGPLAPGTMALIKEPYKLVHYFGYPRYASEYELYDLVNDPEERHDLAESQRADASDLGNELKTKLREANSAYLES